MKKSSIDEYKENNEQACWRYAVELSVRAGGTTGSIIRHISGEPLERDKEDAPDIVNVCKRGNKNKRDVYVGIEHFIVDRSTRVKRGKRISPSAESREHIRRAYEKGHSELIETNDVSEATRDFFMNEAGKLLEIQTNSDVQSLVESLHYSLNKHMGKVDSYRENLSKMSGEVEIEIALLIELHAEFPSVILNDGSSCRWSEQDKLLFVDEMVKEFDVVDETKVNYIIILFYPNDFNPPTDIVAFRTGNIRKNLNNQKRKVYRNAFHHNKTESFSWTHKRNEKGDYDITHGVVVDRWGMMMQNLRNVGAAYECKKRGLPYATNVTVQANVEAIYDDVVGFSDNGDPVYKKNINIQRCQNRFMKEIEKWDPELAKRICETVR